MNSLFSFENHENPLVAYLNHISKRNNLVSLGDVFIFKNKNIFRIKTLSNNCFIDLNEDSCDITISRLDQDYDNSKTYRLNSVCEAKAFLPILVGVFREHGLGFDEAERLASDCFGIYADILTVKNKK